MSRTLKIAAIQMDATPSPLDERLNRAVDLIAEAVTSGAQLIVLPELFNTGYEYHERNYDLAERLDGTTVTWMKTQAAQHGIHLAGALLLLDGSDIYNTALLIAPNGQVWRYDKNYPFLWERAFFRAGNHITVADTELGKLGMMICWDAAHPAMWQQYTGQIDAMVVMSCPPKLSSADLVFPDGGRVNVRDLGGLWQGMYTDEEYFPGRDMDEHAAWLGVPVVNTAGGGKFRSKMPLSKLSLFSYLLLRPDLWSKLRDASKVQIEAGYDPQTKVIAANGQVMSRVNSPGDGLVMSEVALADDLPQPQDAQPNMRTSPFTFFGVDTFGSTLMAFVYRLNRRHFKQT
ncbi:MAG: carbon-nitrogen hydrolase family protein [Chloroflexota bacterium]